MVTHLVNSHEMFAVWRSYNFKDLKADLSQQEQGGNQVGNVGSEVWTEKLANAFEIFRDDLPVPIHQFIVFYS